MGGGALLKVVAQHFDVLALPVVSLLYPLYASVKAIETESRHDDRQWLTYWVLYSMITLCEMTFSKIIVWIPFWSYAKLIATCWLVLPYFNGAAYVYEHFIRPCFVNPHPVNIWIFSGKKSNLNTLPDNCSSAVERYIADNGKEAFERLMAQIAELTVSMDQLEKERDCFMKSNVNLSNQPVVSAIRKILYAANDRDSAIVEAQKLVSKSITLAENNTACTPDNEDRHE